MGELDAGQLIQSLLTFSSKLCSLEAEIAEFKAGIYNIISEIQSSILTSMGMNDDSSVQNNTDDSSSDSTNNYSVDDSTSSDSGSSEPEPSSQAEATPATPATLQPDISSTEVTPATVTVPSPPNIPPEVIATGVSSPLTSAYPGATPVIDPATAVNVANITSNS